MKAFDLKFGSDFLSQVPSCPGIYFFRDAKAQILYVGKAKNLKKRLRSYRSLARSPRSKKVSRMLKEASQLTYQVTASDLEARILEINEIQTHRPKWNVVARFFHLYPYVGYQQAEDSMTWVYTTQPQKFPGFRFFGCFRSRALTLEAFLGLKFLLQRVGHLTPQAKRGAKKKPRFSHQFEVRHLPSEWHHSEPSLWVAFWQGQSDRLLGVMALQLIENAAARASASLMEHLLKRLRFFWRREARLLHLVQERTCVTQGPIPQKTRDFLFLYSKALKSEPQLMQELLTQDHLAHFFSESRFPDEWQSLRPGDQTKCLSLL